MHADAAGQRKAHADECRRQQHDGEGEPESGREQRDPLLLQPEQPVLTTGDQRPEQRNAEQRREDDAQLHPTEDAARIVDARIEQVDEEAAQRDADQERNQHGGECISGGADDEDQDAGPDHLQRERRDSG